MLPKVPVVCADAFPPHASCCHTKHRTGRCGACRTGTLRQSHPVTGRDPQQWRLYGFTLTTGGSHRRRLRHKNGDGASPSWRCCCRWVTTDAWAWPSEALALCVEGGRVSHSWCMCVVNHGYGGGRDRGGWYVCGAKPRGLVACRAMPEDCGSARWRHRSQRRPGALPRIGSTLNWSVSPGRHEKVSVSCPCSWLAGYTPSCSTAVVQHHCTMSPCAASWTQTIMT